MADNGNGGGDQKWNNDTVSVKKDIDLGAAGDGTQNVSNNNNNNNNNTSSTERKPKGKNEEKKIFVGGIGWDTSEEDLKSFFGQFGEVAHVQVKYDHFTGRSRGFAFVEFTSGDACREALRQKDRDIKGKKCEVKPAKSRENKKIFIGGLPAEYPEDDLRRHFESFGRVDEIEWPFDKFQNKRKNFAFVVFEDEDAASRAAANAKQKFGERMCDVKVAVPQYMRPQKQQGGGWGVHAGANNWGDYTSYGGYGYGGYGGGYNYYDDRYGTYDYGSGYGGGAGYDNWGSYGGSALSATASGGGHRTGRGGGGNAVGYGSYY